jgi:hypothetical protein
MFRGPTFLYLGENPNLPLTSTGCRSDQERVPCFLSKDPVRRGEERLIRCAVDWPPHLPAQDRNLVSQNGDLEFRIGAIVRAE